LLSETLLIARRSEKNTSKDRAFSNLFAQGSPDSSGNFRLRNLASGQFNLDVRFFAKYWYVRSIAREAIPVQPVTGRVGVNSRQTDAARTGISLKFGERVSGLTVTLAEGAASLRGAVKIAAGESVSHSLFQNCVHRKKRICVHGFDVPQKPPKRPLNLNLARTYRPSSYPSRIRRSNPKPVALHGRIC